MTILKRCRLFSLVAILPVFLFGSLSSVTHFALAQTGQRNAPEPTGDLTLTGSELRGMIERYIVDRGNLNRSYIGDTSAFRETRMKKFYTEWLSTLEHSGFDTLSHDGRVDYLLFRNHLNHELLGLDLEAKARAEMAPLIPFALTINELAEARRRMDKIEPSEAAAKLARLAKQVEVTRRAVEAGLRPTARGDNRPDGNAGDAIGVIQVKKAVANRAIGAINGLRNSLRK